MFDFIVSLQKFLSSIRFGNAIWIRVLFFTFVATVGIVAVYDLAQAQSESDGESAAPPKASNPAKTSTGKSDGKTKRTKIDFEDQLIEGRATKPELFVLLQNRMNNSRRLFKLRENFLPEMRKTAEDTSRTGGGK